MCDGKGLLGVMRKEVLLGRQGGLRTRLCAVVVRQCVRQCGSLKAAQEWRHCDGKELLSVVCNEEVLLGG